MSGVSAVGYTREPATRFERPPTNYDWLGVIVENDKPLRFTFTVGNIPVKFFHGEADEAPGHYCTASDNDGVRVC